MKKTCSVLLCLMMLLVCLSSCYFNPPEGWTTRHHTYEDALAFAQSIDPNATVMDHFFDTETRNGWEYREWNAVIHGVDCHVASVSDDVWNDGLAAGEFSKSYYRMGTDYNYTVLRPIIVDSNWKIEEDRHRIFSQTSWRISEDIYFRYHVVKSISVELIMAEYRELDDEELEQIWQSACEIHEDYRNAKGDSNLVFRIPSPGKGGIQGKGEFWDEESATYIKTFTQDGKAAFFEEYRENWALRDSGLPTYEELQNG